MKTDDIRAFVAVVQFQSLNVAGEVLGLTQPAITRRIQNLEESLGAELLDRNTKPMRPSQLGWQVFEQSRAVLRELDALRALVAPDAAPSGALRIGITQVIGDTALIEALGELRQAYPDLRPQISTGWSRELVGRVETGELHAATVFLPATMVFPAKLSAACIGGMNVVVAAAKGQFKSRIQGLRELYQHGWILNPAGCGFRAHLERALSARGLPLTVKLDAFGSELQLGLVAAGLGLGLAPSTVMEASRHRKQLDVLAVSDFELPTSIWLVQAEVQGALGRAVEVFGRAVARRFKAQRARVR